MTLIRLEMFAGKERMVLYNNPDKGCVGRRFEAQLPPYIVRAHLLVAELHRSPTDCTRADLELSAEHVVLGRVKLLEPTPRENIAPGAGEWPAQVLHDVPSGATIALDVELFGLAGPGWFKCDVLLAVP